MSEHEVGEIAPRQETRSVPATIQAVARAAGVSKTTVSHVISGNRPVSTTTRRRVERVMDELGFRPNFFAQALTKNRSKTIALIAQDITNPFYPALARGLQGAAATEQHVVMLFDAGAGERLTHAFLEEAVQRRVDGVVLAVALVDGDLRQLTDAGIPVVAVGSGLSDVLTDWVSADDRQIAVDAVRYLTSRGHSRLATITGPPAAEPGAGRLEGFERALANAGRTPDPRLIVAGDWTRDGGARAMRQLLELPDRPSAVFCANDLMAIGAVDAARSAGLDVPRDVAVVGVDDIDASSLVSPALTTVRIPAQAIGRAAGELLLDRIAGRAGPAVRHVLVRHSLIQRDSA
ncbi:LacI family DNA-binding transcriptional regulator [Lysobacter korlensis]|uniref:LacI family DNA-binding transcriptional regulator n=1 Tax=Lysobacter korlensis TaxID=553636 RepID=A0ABV6S044_9GAMM